MTETLDIQALENQFRTFNQEVLGNSVTWSRNQKQDSITVTKTNGTPFLREIKGSWTTEEVSAALYLFQFTDANRR